MSGFISVSPPCSPCINLNLGMSTVAAASLMIAASPLTPISALTVKLLTWCSFPLKSCVPSLPSSPFSNLKSPVGASIGTSTWTVTVVACVCCCACPVLRCWYITTTDGGRSQSSWSVILNAHPAGTASALPPPTRACVVSCPGCLASTPCISTNTVPHITYNSSAAVCSSLSHPSSPTARAKIAITHHNGFMSCSSSFMFWAILSRGMLVACAILSRSSSTWPCPRSPRAAHTLYWNPRFVDLCCVSLPFDTISSSLGPEPPRALFKLVLE